MDKKQQPDALRLAEMLTADEWPGSVTLVSYARECVAELLRQHAENETVRAGYAAARLEVESLKAQLHAAKQINAAQFGLLAASIPGSALRASHGQAPASKIEGLTAAQESLGVEFERVLHDNLFDLYEESPHTARLESAQADSVLEDAARWHWMAEYIVGTRTELDDALIASASVDDLRKLVDADLAARKQGATQ